MATENTTTFDEQISTLVACIREERAEIERHEVEVQEAKAQLLPLLEQRGSNWADDQGYARIAQEGLRYDYDTNALDELIISDPLRYGWLKDYRKTSAVPSRLLVR
jgi:hypothetical protein